MKITSVILIYCLIGASSSCTPDNSNRCVEALKSHLNKFSGINANDKAALLVLHHNTCSAENLIKLLRLYDPISDQIEVTDPDALVQFYTLRVHLSHSEEDAYLEVIYEENGKFIITGIGFRNRQSGLWNQSTDTPSKSEDKGAN